MRAARTDGNQTEIVDALRAVGALVHITSRQGGGYPDLTVGFRGRIWLIECKDGGRLTPAQKKWHTEWQGYCYVANSPREALMIIGAWVPILEGSVA